MAVGRGRPHARTPRLPDVSAQPLAGGGGTGGRIYIDPRYDSTLPFRDETRLARDTGYTLSVAEDLAESMRGLDIQSGKKKKTAAVKQFQYALQRADIEHQKAPQENLLEPYRQAFDLLIADDPNKAMALLGTAGLPLDTASAIGSSGFKRLLAENPAVAKQTIIESGMGEDFIRALFAAPERAVAPAAAGPAAAAFRNLPSVDLDPVIPARPEVRPVPFDPKKDQPPRILLQPGKDWTQQQVARGWRAITYVPETPGGAPRNVVEVLADRWRTDLKPQPATPEMPNPELGQPRQIYQPVQPPAAPLLEGLRRDVAGAQVSPKQLLAGLSGDERVALERAQDLAAALRTGRQVSLGQEVAPNSIEGMQQVPLAAETDWFDNTPQARDLNRAIADLTKRYPRIAGLIDSSPAVAPAPRGPLAPLDRGDFQISLTHLLGGWNQAKPFFFEDRVSNVPKNIGPLIKQAENVAALERITGQRFIPQLPAETATTGPLNRGLTPDDLPENYSQMTPAQQKKAREKLESKIEGSTGDRPMYGVGGDPAVSQALSLIDKQVPLVRGKRRIDLDSLEEKYPAVVAEVRKIMAQSDAKFGGPVILRDQTSIDTKPYERRSLIARGRGKLTRAQEQLIGIVEGTTKYMPTVLRGRKVRVVDALTDAEAAADKKQMAGPWARVPARSRAKRMREGLAKADEAIRQGGIYPLDEVASYWRGTFLFMDPDDGNVYVGRLTPGVLARLIAQQLVIDDPARLRQLKDMVRRSMEVYERLPPTDAAAKFLDEKGAPRFVPPSKTYMKTLVDSFESKGLEFSPIMRQDPLADPPAPAAGQRKFFPISPLTGLVK